ncbi:MAG: hypothetical protein MHM6MM_001628 [Cercozoa sp. M6MM]
MRVNENTSLEGERVRLVPYEKKHVETYHSWMEDPVLREQTASERLTLEQEYEMQQTWRADNKLLTFIVVEKRDTGSDVDNMVGDINLFLPRFACEDPEKAEVSLMLAVPTARGKGFAHEAFELLLDFVRSAASHTESTDKDDTASQITDEWRHLAQVRVIQAKLGAANLASRHFFERHGFQQVDYVEVFDEYTFARQL